MARRIFTPRDVAPLDSGNGMLFTADSTYRIAAGKLVRATARRMLGQSMLGTRSSSLMARLFWRIS